MQRWDIAEPITAGHAVLIEACSNSHYFPFLSRIELSLTWMGQKVGRMMVFPLITPLPALISVPRPRLFIITFSRSSKPAPVRSLLEIILSNARPAKPSGQTSRLSCTCKALSRIKSYPPYSLQGIQQSAASQGCGCVGKMLASAKSMASCGITLLLHQSMPSALPQTLTTLQELPFALAKWTH